MKNERKIVRDFAVFCALSKLRNRSAEIKLKHQDDKRRLDLTLEYILSDVFEEPIDYCTLLHFYSEALQGKENAYFSYAYFCDKKHAIRIDKSGNILLYFYQDDIKIGIPWNYPHLITCIGTINSDENLCSVLNDLKKMSTLDYLLKYFFRRMENQHSINTICEGYLVDGFLKIIINEHITFQWMDSNNNYQEKYIADSWGITKKDIIFDLTSKNLLSFGKTYAGFWGK